MNTRISISLGTRALPAVKDAIEHAQQNPTHNPIVFASVVEDEPRLRWICHGSVATQTSESPFNICAKGGEW